MFDVKHHRLLLAAKFMIFSIRVAVLAKDVSKLYTMIP